MCVCVCIQGGRVKVLGLKSSCNKVISAVEDIFLPMRSKYCNTDGRSVGTTRGTWLKNKSHLITFHDIILVSQ